MAILHIPKNRAGRGFPENHGFNGRPAPHEKSGLVVFAIRDLILTRGNPERLFFSISLMK